MSLRLELHNEPLPMSAPFRIAGHVFEAMPATIVTLHDGDHVGRGEAAGVYYNDDHPDTMIATLEALRPRIEAGIDRASLRALLPPGGARNALDAALWELEAQRSGAPVWRLAGLDGVRPLLTTFTVGADDPGVMADRAAAYVQGPKQARVSLLEQPCVRGREHELDGIERVLPFAADESILDLAELEARHSRFDVINIKLDKCGGLTEGLMMARRARELGKQVMVGNMCGTSLAAAPAYVLGQFCDIVDLDGPTFLVQDRTPSVQYEDGCIRCGDEVWGPRVAA